MVGKNVLVPTAQSDQTRRILAQPQQMLYVRFALTVMMIVQKVTVIVNPLQHVVTSCLVGQNALVEDAPSDQTRRILAQPQQMLYVSFAQTVMMIVQKVPVIVNPLQHVVTSWLMGQNALVADALPEETRRILAHPQQMLYVSFAQTVMMIVQKVPVIVNPI